MSRIGGQVEGGGDAVCLLEALSPTKAARPLPRDRSLAACRRVRGYPGGYTGRLDWATNYITLGASMTVSVRVFIHGKDNMIGAMVKALSFEIGGPSSVAGNVRAILDATGFYTFKFASEDKAIAFRSALATYLPRYFAHVVDE